MQIEFGMDYEYAGLQYFEGDKIDMYDEEAQSLINQGVAREVEEVGEGE